MSRAWLVGLLVLWAGLLGGYAQPSEPNRIDGINTAQAVTALIQAADSAGHFARVTISDTLSIRNRACKCQARKKGVRPWVKADFDNNGYTDLLAIGDANRQEVLLVMAFGSGRYEVQKLNYGSKYCFLPTLAGKSNQPVLNVISYQRKFGGLLGRSRRYRLVYKYGGLVEDNVRPDSRQVESVSLSYFMSYHSTEKVDMTITDSGLAVCQKETDGVVTNRVALLPQSELQALTELVKYVAVAGKRSVYTRSGNHHPHYYLTVAYEGGYKQIDDDGGEGSMGLELLYSRILGLQNSLHWQEVKQ